MDNDKLKLAMQLGLINSPDDNILKALLYRAVFMVIVIGGLVSIIKLFL